MQDMARLLVCPHVTEGRVRIGHLDAGNSSRKGGIRDSEYWQVVVLLQRGKDMLGSARPTRIDVEGHLNALHVVTVLR